jgi:hypothetical protein
MSRWIGAATAHAVVEVHRGAVFPAGRVVLIAVPVAALIYYYFVVRRHRGR